ncbi:hypothetical protein [Protaetiibacter larvae]|uniref:DUF4232 domain-containing protein n=1 Tax=Protaetiibacter larvae TaxID=2592654 RepID=A0A5C1Y578_9MICO|nr:hypothetical protein [Protaetiibacter larvae]QEO09193.1 hypothetical protein FLP23_03695 [Protaetiibacter larvae]
MSSEQPGRLPASVYRRRRVVVGLAVLAVIVVIVLLVIPRGGDDPDRAPGAGSSQTPSDDETTDGAAADPTAACDPAVIELTPVIDATEFPAGQNPLISMEITNTGAVPCTINVGTDAQRYDIVSGADPIWNSQDCQTSPTPQDQVLQPGVAVSTTPFPWDRTRSSADTCSADRPQVTAGGATYRLSVSLGDVTSASDVPFLLY